MSEIALRFLALNIGAGLVVLVVLALRKLVRARFGASLAYALWLLVPLVAIASLLPPRTIEIAQPVDEAAMSSWLPKSARSPAPVDVAQVRTAPEAGMTTAPGGATLAPAQLAPAPARQAPAIDPWSLAMLVWLAGVAVSLAWQVRNQSRFMAQARRGKAGPAVAGLLRPHIVMPADFEQRFDAREREIIIAHETVHMDRNDARINGLAALFRCLCWFNPLIHVGAHFMRIDQELACDAVVTQRHPRARAVYASALLKAQLAGSPLPAGCYWPAKASHTLVERIEMLDVATPGKRARLAGMAVLALLAVGSGLAAWAGKPPVTKYASDRIEPARQEATPAAASEFDPADPLYLRGKVERIDFSETQYTVIVRASSIAPSEASEAKADTRLWQLKPTNFWGDRDAVNADLLGKTVAVRGYAPKNKSCTPACKVLVRGFVIVTSTELPAVTPSSRFGVTEVNHLYDLGSNYTVEGRVQSIKFSDRTFDAYVATPPNGTLPGRVFQVRSEYDFPRADIEKALLGRAVLVKGWPARKNIDGLAPFAWSASASILWSPYANCETTCSMYGKEFLRDDGATVMPGEDELLQEPLTTDPFFGSFPTATRRDSGITLTGKVTDAKTRGVYTEVVVEETVRTPASFTGPRPGTVWRVSYLPEGFRFDTPNGLPPSFNAQQAKNWIGRTLTFSGKAGPRGGSSNVRSCETDCRFYASDIMAFD